MVHPSCDQPVDEVVVLVKNAYGAFNRRDIDGALDAMTADVEWENGWEGGHVHGHKQVRDYWSRQWAELDPFVAPLAISVDGDGRVIVLVDQQIRRLDGSLVHTGEVRHVLTMRDGLVARLDIEDVRA